MTHVTCWLTAKNRDLLRNPTLGNRVGDTFTFTFTFTFNAFSISPALVLPAHGARADNCRRTPAALMHPEQTQSDVSHH